MADVTTVIQRHVPDEIEARRLLDEIILSQRMETGHVVPSYYEIDPTLHEDRRLVAAIHRLVFHPLGHTEVPC